MASGPAWSRAACARSRRRRTGLSTSGIRRNIWSAQAGFGECQEADRDASAKPTWAAIEAAHAIAAPPALREQREGELRAECRRRITAAYGAADWQDEIEKRAGGRVSAEQDAERDRLRATHAALKAALAGLTLGELEAFKPADDASWAANDDHEEENDGS